jgi:hypothetical protein
VLRDTSSHAGGSALIDACAAVVSLVGHGLCNAMPDTGHRVADERGQRVAQH